MYFEIVDSYFDFIPLKDEWNSLLASSGYKEVFLTYEWFDCWVRAFKQKSDLRIVLLKDAGELIGVAPLEISRCWRKGMPIKKLHFLSNSDSPACNFIVKGNNSEYKNALLDYMVKNIEGWDIVYLMNVPVNECDDSFFEYLNQRDLRYIAKKGYHTPILRTDMDWESYYKSLKARTRKGLRNVANRVEKNWNFDVRCHVDREGLELAKSIARKGWKYKEGKEFICDRSREYFFESLTEIASDRNWLKIWVLYFNDRPVAYEYHLKFIDKAIALICAYDEEYKKYSPGTFLDYLIVKNYFLSEDVDEYLMGGDIDYYKRKWTETIMEHGDFTFFNDSYQSMVLYYLEKMISEGSSEVLKIRSV